MADLNTTKVTLPTTVTTAVAARLHDNSVVAAFSPADALTGYHNDAYNYFTGGARAEVVGESKAKKAHDVAVKPVPGKLVKVHTTTRVSDELSWADADDQLAIIEAIQNDQAAAAAEALDYVILHAVNPLDGTALSDYTALTAGATSVTSTGDDPSADIDALADAVADYDITGIGLSRTFAGNLRKLRAASGQRLYPEIPLSLNTGVLDGVPAVTSSNVNGKLATTPTKVLAIAGDWNTIRWRIARPLTASIIAYGDPDGAGDLQRYGQIAYRSELVFSYAVLDPKRLAVLKPAAGK